VAHFGLSSHEKTNPLFRAVMVQFGVAAVPGTTIIIIIMFMKG